MSQSGKAHDRTVRIDTEEQIKPSGLIPGNMIGGNTVNNPHVSKYQNIIKCLNMITETSGQQIKQSVESLELL